MPCSEGAVLRHRHLEGWQAHEEESFAFLRQMIVKDAQVVPVVPRRCVQEDQIVWWPQPGPAGFGRRLDRHPALLFGERGAAW